MEKRFIAPLVILLIGAPSWAADAPSKPTAAQLNAPVGAYRRAKDDAARNAAIDQALDLGEAGRTKLAAVVSRDLKTALRSYKSRFGKAALRTGALLRKKQAAEMEKHRRAVLGLKADAALAKSAIVQNGDPAIEQLFELLIPKRELILESSKSLAKAAAEIDALLAASKRLAGPEDKDPEKALRDDEALALHMALATKPDHWKVLAENHKILPTLDAEEAKGIYYLNQVRMLLGMNPLAIDTKLSDASRDHSKDMAEKGFFSHTSPVAGKASFTDRAKNFGTRARAENIAAGQKDGKRTIVQWWHSPGHFKNMLGGGHRRIGLGRFNKTWTQMFG